MGGAERNKGPGIWGGLGVGGATVGMIAGAFCPVVALLLAPRMVPERVRRRFDALGAITGTAGLVLLVDAVPHHGGTAGAPPARLQCAPRPSRS